MKYSIKFHDMVFPKYAKLVFSVNTKGNMTIAAAPSFTPGKNPPGMQNGQLPKGSKVFDYTKEILVSIDFTDCLAIMDFANSRNTTKQVDIFRKSADWNKKVTIVYMPDDNDPLVPKMATIYFESTLKTGTIKFYLPLSLKSLDELAKICEAYTNNVIMIKLNCGIEKEHENDNASTNSSTNASTNVEYKVEEVNNAANNTASVINQEYANLY